MQVLPSKNAVWWCYPETNAIKLADELGILVVTGIIFVCRAMLFIRCKVPGRRLIVKPVKR